MGTRGSSLALAQSRQVAAILEAAHPNLRIEERIIRTTGDERRNVPLPQIGGKGVFTLEIESALQSGEIDFAVHSLKDLPPDLPEGLCLAAVPKRASASDVLIHSAIRNLQSAIKCVGTSSLRRRAQLLHEHPDWQIEDIRGNIDTRLRKLEEENFDAIVLAQAGLQRLQLDEKLASRMEVLDPKCFVPAPGQGALGIEARPSDKSTLTLLQAIEDQQTRIEISAERALIRKLNAGCATPLGAHAVVIDGALSMHACVLSPDGAERIYAELKGDVSQADKAGVMLAHKLLERGAREFLAKVNV